MTTTHQPLTMQQAYDRLKAHLLKQNMRAQMGDPNADGGSCAYRNEAGLKCAIGCLLPDEFFELKALGVTDLSQRGQRLCDFNGAVDWLKVDFPAVSEFLGGLSDDFLTDAQSLHDNEDIEDWPEELTRLAETYGLKP